MMKFNDYDWTFNDLRERIENAKLAMKRAGNYKREAEYGVILDALNAIEERETTGAFIEAVNDYNELSDAVAVYLTRAERTKRHDRDLVLDVLVEAARERFNDMEAFINDARYYLTDEGRSALKDALSLNFKPIHSKERSELKC